MKSVNARLNLVAKAALNKMKRIEAEAERDAEKDRSKRLRELAKSKLYVKRTKSAQDAAFEKVWGKGSANKDFGFWK